MASKAFVESLESRVMLSASAAPLVAAAHLVVQGQGLVIAKGDATPSRQDFTDFGQMSTSRGAATRRYIVKNTGTTPLSISALSVGGVNPGDFTVINAPTSIAPGGQAPVVIRFSPLATGARSGRVVIFSNDSANPKDTFVIQGTGLATTDLPDGLQYATTVPGSGRATISNTVVAVSYTGYLLNGVVFDSSVGKGPFEFKIDETNPNNIQVIAGWNEGLKGMLPGERRTLFIPASLGYGTVAKQGIPANSTLIFETKLMRTGTLDVLGKRNALIPSGSTVASSSLGTLFPPTTMGTTVSRNFVLKTNDAENRILGLSTINITGKQSGQFTWGGGGYDSTLGGWPIVITYNAGKIGMANVTVSIPSNDPSYPDYTFVIHAQTT